MHLLVEVNLLQFSFIITNFLEKGVFWSYRDSANRFGTCPEHMSIPNFTKFEYVRLAYRQMIAEFLGFVLLVYFPVLGYKNRDFYVLLINQFSTHFWEKNNLE